MSLITSFARNLHLGELNSPLFTGNPVPLTPAQRKVITKANIGLTDGQAVVPSVAAINASATATAAQMLGGVITSTSAAAVALTVPTGTQMDAFFVAPTFSSDFVANFATTFGQTSTLTIVNTGPNTVTLTAAAGFTIVGAAAIPTATSGTFLLVRTAVNTWVAYRE